MGRMEQRASRMLDQCSSVELHPQHFLLLFGHKVSVIAQAGFELTLKPWQALNLTVLL